MYMSTMFNRCYCVFIYRHVDHSISSHLDVMAKKNAQENESRLSEENKRMQVQHTHLLNIAMVSIVIDILYVIYLVGIARGCSKVYE